MRTLRILPCLLLGLFPVLSRPALAQSPNTPRPDTVFVQAGGFTLHALLWHPTGPGPFPAVLFSHGSYGATDTIGSSDPDALAAVFVRNGYEFLFLFRSGVGLSRDQGSAEGTLMARAQAEGGLAQRNTTQLNLLQGEALVQARAALRWLRARREVDPRQVALIGHSFGGSLTLGLAAQDTIAASVVVFGAAAGSWPKSPALQRFLLTAVSQIQAPVLLLHAANDYSTRPGVSLAATRDSLHKPTELHIYPPVGRSPAEGHNFLYRAPPIWEADVMAFLTAQRRP